jgi:cell division protein FtsL
MSSYRHDEQKAIMYNGESLNIVTDDSTDIEHQIQQRTSEIQRMQKEVSELQKLL